MRRVHGGIDLVRIVPPRRPITFARCHDTALAMMNVRLLFEETLHSSP